MSKTLQKVTKIGKKYNNRHFPYLVLHNENIVQFWQKSLIFGDDNARLFAQKPFVSNHLIKDSDAQAGING